MSCLWCDEPTEGENPLCPACHAVNTGPRFHCKVPGHTVPTMGTACAECEMQAAREQRRRELNAPIIEQLQAIRLQPVRHRDWHGALFAKTLVGSMIDRAILDLGGTLVAPPEPETAYERHMRALDVLKHRKNVGYPR